MEPYGHSSQKEFVVIWDSLGLEGFESFVVDNDEAIKNELLYNFKKCIVSLVNKILTLCTMKFSTDSWENFHIQKITADRYFSNFLSFANWIF